MVMEMINFVNFLNGCHDHEMTRVPARLNHEDVYLGIVSNFHMQARLNH
jgi:hypothetical protein